MLFAEGTTGDGNMILPFKSTLFGAATMALQDGAVDKVYIQPLTIAYTRLQGMPMGRRDRPLASWIGDTALAPHAAALLSAGAVDVELHFGEAVAFAAGDNSKDATRRAESKFGPCCRKRLGNPRPSKA